jgi:hypothetical protein
MNGGTSIFLSSLAGLLVAVVSWFGLEFIGRPVRQFYDLRREVRRQLAFLANVSAAEPRRQIVVDVHGRNIAEERRQRLQEAQRIFRDLGSQMIAFAHSERPAARVVRLRGFDPAMAADGLIGLSNTLPKYGEERASHRAKIIKGLRFKLPEFRA